MKRSENALKDLELVKVLQGKKSTKKEKQMAFNKLFSSHKEGIKWYFLKQTRGKVELAEDLMMITFEKVHSKIDHYDSDKGAFSTWLYNIALNSLIDHKRTEKYEILSLDGISAKTSDENGGMEFQLDAGVEDPEKELIRHENIERVRGAICAIEADFVREVMQLRYEEDMSCEEITEQMKANPNTVRVALKRGREIVEQNMLITE
jgi:RNA polymerase sigma-70 factor, ECF subfamily